MLNRATPPEPDAWSASGEYKRFPERGHPGGIVVVIGVPGSGKTTIAKKLALNIGCSYLNVGSLARERGYVLGIDKKRDSLILNEDLIADEIRRLACEKCLVIETIDPNAIPRELVRAVIVVRCRPSVLLERLKLRKYSLSKIRENIEYEAIDGSVYDALLITSKERIIEVDGCDKELEDEIEVILDFLRGKIAGKVGKFDWSTDFMEILDRLSQDGQ